METVEAEIQRKIDQNNPTEQDKLAVITIAIVMFACIPLGIVAANALHPLMGFAVFAFAILLSIPGLQIAYRHW